MQDSTSKLAQQPRGNSVKVGISDVARAANVSTATVSRALRGLPRVSHGTRQKVLAMAGQLGYVISPTASGLATGRTRTMGILATPGNDVFNWQAVQEASRELNRRGYGLALFSLHDFNNSLELFLRTANVENRCDGLLVLGKRFKDEETELLRVLRIPSATVAGSVSDTRLDAEGIKLAAEAIRQLFARVRVA
jgi:LacI family transcriptional regulator, repressor for deo operon, udp, cdd, tsx, nupC, and nupG